MTELPPELRYTRAHEWAREEDDRVVVGITDYAQDQLGDVVFVGLPETGTEVEAGQPFGEVESTKSVSDVYSPVSGNVVAKNPDVEDSPDLINSDPYGKGWLIAISPRGDLDGLLSAREYERFIAESEGEEEV
jgi:glycine cleavage system H protein